MVKLECDNPACEERVLLDTFAGVDDVPVGWLTLDERTLRGDNDGHNDGWATLGIFCSHGCVAAFAALER